MTTEPERAWASRYRTNLGTYESCAGKLESLIRDLVGSADIDVVAIESRAKDPESLERKVDEKRESYEEPLADVTDLIGVRIISYYLEDVEKIKEIIGREFDVDAENSMDKLDDLEPDRFGYRSVHFVVTLDQQRAALAEWSVFEGQKAEIQVRTATQHAWAAVEHKLSYKRTSQAPRKLRRKLTRLSALFELADEQFSVVKAELEAVETRYSNDVRGGNLDLPLDTSSLHVFIEANSRIAELAEEFEARGFGASDPKEEGYEERYNRDLQDLATILDSLGVETIAEFDVLLREALSDESNIDEIAGVFKSLIVTDSPADLLSLFIGIVMEAPTSIFEQMYKDSVVKVIRELRGETQHVIESDSGS